MASHTHRTKQAHEGPGRKDHEECGDDDDGRKDHDERDDDDGAGLPPDRHR